MWVTTHVVRILTPSVCLQCLVTHRPWGGRKRETYSLDSTRTEPWMKAHKGQKFQGLSQEMCFPSKSQSSNIYAPLAFW